MVDINGSREPVDASDVLKPSLKLACRFESTLRGLTWIARTSYRHWFDRSSI
ncbi:hypothetical protein BRPE64_ECDS02940 (plasmid) [Caballeronia insecticola]|uniref:Uncharacterized protein n=1 Tax=Caballeronia insecticola TaxID=758793 RepID=A0A060PKT1_9BURK|nr:hypothetical protein BRPE64_ECDS02940 [Caballeronia insecticola]